MCTASALSEVLGLKSGCSEHKRQAQESQKAKEQCRPSQRESGHKEMSEWFLFSLSESEAEHGKVQD